MPNHRLVIEYDGTRYHGWQIQSNARSVAGELRRAIESTGAGIVELGGAGRTDAGVHALAQSAHLRLRSAVTPEPFRRAVNDALPADIHVLAVIPAAETFHSRHDALSRTYLYQISRRRTAHAKRYVWWVRQPLDLAAMAEAARSLAGTHDFAGFCERPAAQASTIVSLASVDVAAAEDLILVRLTASHFLWKMVRRIVGVLAKVGAGELDRSTPAELLEGRTPAGLEEGIARWTAPASGLFLERVTYPGEPGPGPPAPVVSVAGATTGGYALYAGGAAPRGAAARPRR